VRRTRRIEELAAQLGLRRVRPMRARAGADLNRAATEAFGPLDVAKASVLGSRAYFEDQDVDIFVTGSTDLTFPAVPIGTEVTETGEVVLRQCQHLQGGCVLKRPLTRLLLVALATSALAACAGGRGEPEAPQLGVVSTGPRRLSITQPPGHVCVRAVRMPATAAVSLPFG
jgi:hypothetical protein